MKLDEIPLLPQDESLIPRISRENLSFSPEQVWSPSPSVHHRTTPYPVPKTLRQGLRVTVETGAKFSPPPFAAIVEGDDHRVLIGVEADAGWHLWNFIDFTVTEKSAEIRIDLEGHSDPAEVAEHVRVVLARSPEDEPRMGLLARTMRELYPEGTSAQEQIPDWWLRPIYCGWADQVAQAKYENGARAGGGGRYCTRKLYERWIERLEEAELPIGTVILDAGWATGVWEPDPEKWPDLKGFITSQHNAGRKVLLWIGTWVCGGVPAELCVMAGNRKICVDPTNPQYRSLIRERIEELLSPEGYDADGFKIDQLGRPPSERPAKSPKYAHLPAYHEEQENLLQIHGDRWGCELLHLHQADFHRAAVAAKPDALLTSSTVHPYFHDTFGMVRLHDTGKFEGDIMDVMGARADLSRAALPGKPIDTDNWISRNYDMWLRYTCNSYRLGVPCILYSERFIENWEEEPATRPIPMEDLREIARTWRENYMHAS